ncbi:hypothetical protein F5X68DRAFT_199809 [Plectosphaerella plurivora]|uniref:FAD-binding domain-containing protein n=1 Tax=Plectosphaerella plurivora TaxID=936078 RepID=A0A9P8VL94_9PEZI|nr:hypothetical protein F5X68DRAFT_199809 [Plectosphaerella plurivora]
MTSFTVSNPDVIRLEVAIVGAGMGGLVSALSLARKGFKNIHVYEAARDLGFVGAGIQLAPNLVRILSRLGCWEAIENEATEVLETSIRDGPTDQELTHVHMPDIRKKYGYPHCTGHRASLAGGLYKACQNEEAITFHFDHTLESVDSFSPQATMQFRSKSGATSTVTADILIAADGIKSIARGAILNQLGAPMETEDTGQAAYRIMLPREKMASDPEMLALLDSNQVTRWIGEKRHWICYPIAGRRIYNMSSIQPDKNFSEAPSATYTTKGSKDTMLQVFSDFCPIVQRLLSLAPEGEVCEWKLRVHKPLPTWSHGAVTLVGDACHPTLPHLNQGAAQAVEDGAVLAEVLARAPDARPETMNRCFKVYEAIRKERVTTLVDLAAASGRALHLGAGKDKEARDKAFQEAKEGKGKVPDKWASPEVQQMIYMHDCVQVAADEFDRLYSEANADGAVAER